MTLYYLTQHALIAAGLASWALCMAQFFHLAALPRMLLAASLTPQVIGLLIMMLALLGVHSPGLYMHAPTVCGAAMLMIAASRLKRHDLRHLAPLRISVAGVVIGLICVLIATQLGVILLANAETLNVFTHDFNVYLTSAKVFAAAPAIESMPSFFGGLGDVIVVHPHSFLFEAYLSHALMLVKDISFPPLDFLARSAQQLTMIYLLVAVIGVTVAAGTRWAAVAALCLVVCIPWVYYIPGALSRDAFRMVPIFGLITLLGSLGLNFSSALFRRGLVAGGYAALAIMSHTLGLMLSVILAVCILPCAIIRRRPSMRALALYSLPIMLLGGLSIIRYIQNYIETGGFMGFGLQYSIYQGTWLEPLLGKAWTSENQDLIGILHTLMDRYSWRMQVLTMAVSFAAAFFTRGRGRVIYVTLLLALWAPLLISLSGLLDYAGINLRNGMIVNARYALSFFLLSGPLLAIGTARIGGLLAKRLQSPVPLRQAGAVTVTCIAAWLAHESMLSPSWRSLEASAQDIKQIRFLNRAVSCLMPGDNWFVDDDRWHPYFVDHPPVFAFTLPARPLLTAPDGNATETVLHSMNIKFAAFIETSELWNDSPLYRFLKKNWLEIRIKGGARQLEIWMTPDVAKCLGSP